MGANHWHSKTRSRQEYLDSLRDPLVLGFLEKIQTFRYAPTTLAGKRRVVAAFLRWTRRRHLSLGDLSEVHLVSYLGRKPGWAKARLKLERGALRPFLSFLRAETLVPPVVMETDSPANMLLRRFLDYLRDERGLTKQSRHIYSPLAKQAIAGLEAISGSICPSAWTAGFVNAFLLSKVQNGRTESARLLAVTLRNLLRFLFLRGEIATNLALSVPRVHKWRQASVPMSLTPEEVEQALLTPVLSTPSGQRDHAVLLLLARLGLRAGEVATLELGDILWRTGEIVIHGKGRLVDHLPLLPDIGEALALYLREGRGESASRRVFLRSLAPRTGLDGPSAVGKIVEKALARAGIIRTSRGSAHLFRHGLATRMVQHGASLPEIAEVLRHRSQNSTGIYAKVAFEDLRGVACPWPGSGGEQ